MRAHAAHVRSVAVPVAAARVPRAHPAVRAILRAPAIQPKLTIGAVNDPAEREADRVADQVMRMPEPGTGGEAPTVSTYSGAAPVQRLCPECEESLNRKPAGDSVQRMKQGEGGATDTEDKEVIQAKAQPGRDVSISSASENAIRGLSGGAHLPPSERAFFEPRFGRSFGNVRVHAGSNADHAARAINARAFALGNDIAFARNEFSPGSFEGRRLLAHELAHTVQQSGEPPSVQRGSAGIFGGKCCNKSPDGDERALVGDGEWKRLKSGECTGSTEDCDGMTCGGGFYQVDNLTTGTCITPRVDDDYYRPRRWTPTSQGEQAKSPEDLGSKGGNTPPGYTYDKAKDDKGKEKATGGAYEVGGDVTSNKIVRIAWTFDDGPTPKTPKIESAIGQKRTTWFVMFNQIKGSGAKDETDNLAKLKVIQDNGGEIGIHSYDAKRPHVAWFPMSNKASYDDVDKSAADLEVFYNYLTAAKLLIKFAREPYGLVTELSQWLKDKQISKSEDTARQIIKGEYKGSDPGASEVKSGYEKILNKLKALGLHLWGGSADATNEVSVQSWEAEASGVGLRADDITKHVSAGRAANAASSKDRPGKFERLTDLVAKDGKARSLVVLAHDTTDADAVEVKADKTTMEEYATKKNVKIEYYTMNGLYAAVRGKAP